MVQSTLKFLVVVVVLWFLVLLYIGPTVYQVAEESQSSTLEIKRIRQEIEFLKEDNARIRAEKRSNDGNSNKKMLMQDSANRIELAVKLGKAESRVKELEEQLKQQKIQLQRYEEEEKLKPKEQKNQAAPNIPRKGNSVNFETLRRRVSNQIKEMWFLVSASYSKLEKTIPDTAKGGFENFLNNFGEIQSITERDFNELVTMDGAQKFRDDTAKSLSELIQKRLHQLQNPKDCTTARKLVCSLNKGCGYGCQAHHILYCFLAAYATKRTLIIESSGWRYSSKGWKQYFSEPSDSCTHYDHVVEWNKDHQDQRVVHFPIVDSLFPRPKQMPQNVPREFYEQIRSFHGHPFVWWIGQFTKYLYKYSPAMKDIIEKRKKEMKWEGPIVGIQVRRTDKINTEAAFHSIEEYMYWVKRYYDKLKLTQTVTKKRVFVASDDSELLGEAKKKYPDYEFLGDTAVSKSAGLSNRYTELSLQGVISDIELLSETDFLVCTFSSQVCRLAYEIMNGKHTDASQRFRSLDDIYYFGGQEEHRVKAIWPHEAKSRNQISFNVGDIIGIAGNHWDGESKGRHHNSNNNGLYPAFKVEDVHDVADFPDYDDAAE